MTFRILAACSVLAFFVAFSHALYSPSSHVTILESSNFKSKLRSAGMALVEFYAPWCGHCKQLQPVYEQAASAMKGSILVAAVDADAQQSLAAEHGVKGFPTIKFMYMEGERVKAVDYQGQRTAKDLISFAFEKGKSLALKRAGAKPSSSSSSSSSGGDKSGFYGGTDVVSLTDSNFREKVKNSKDMWMVEFYAPWCGHCQALKPAWIEAAAELKGKVLVGAVDCTASQGVCSELGVQGYPTIKFFGASKSRPEDYQGGRDSSSITSFALEKWSRFAPPPPVNELVGSAVWRRECSGVEEEGVPPKQLCFVAFLPDILDSKASGRNSYIATLQKVAEKFKDRPFSYFWAAGGSQAELEAKLGVGGFGYPALVAFKPKDGRFSLFMSAFELAHINEFVDSIRRGTASVMAAQGPVSVQETQAWDGKDAAVQLEDEFSLDDLNEL